MTVKELIELLKGYPEDLEVVYENFESSSYNFIEGGYMEDNLLKLFEE